MDGGVMLARGFYEMWGKCRQYLLPAIEYTHGTHNEDDIIIMVLAGKLKLWEGARSAMLTEFCQFPRMKTLNVFIGGGDLEELQEMEKQLVPFARENGCARITGCGRLGWTKSLPGYEKGGFFMHKDI